ncbi:hypothetical protein XA68_13293 [Ophiocordyceps unilateralis]|uniref:Uncharacterized protein n=1 Tax=Ophiocordyceps unilateralis TaxID=268505 RepID=A0A2A9PCW4_OPHUN|nr:hypothetical protein XA68_13293 [Ophiocordyceps unilateralis]
MKLPLLVWPLSPSTIFVGQSRGCISLAITSQERARNGVPHHLRNETRLTTRGHLGSSLARSQRQVT